MSVAILHFPLSFKPLINTTFKALTFSDDKSNNSSHDIRLQCHIFLHTQNTALHYATSSTLPSCITSLITLPVECVVHVTCFRHMVANRKQQFLLSSNRNLPITVAVLSLCCRSCPTADRHTL